MSAPEAAEAEDEAESQPTRWSRWIAVVAAGLAVVATAVSFNPAVVVVMTGAVILVLGALREDRKWLIAGYVVAVIGAFLHSLMGGPGLTTLASIIAATVAWDVGEHGMGLNEQLGPSGPATRAEFVHAGTVTLVGLVFGGAAFGIALLFSTNQPRPAVVVLLFAVMLLTAAIREF